MRKCMKMKIFRVNVKKKKKRIREKIVCGCGWMKNTLN